MRKAFVAVAIMVMLLVVAGCGKEAVKETGTADDTVSDAAGAVQEEPADEFSLDTSDVESDLDLAEMEDVDAELDEFDW